MRVWGEGWEARSEIVRYLADTGGRLDTATPYAGFKYPPDLWGLLTGKRPISRARLRRIQHAVETREARRAVELERAIADLRRQYAEAAAKEPEARAIILKWLAERGMKP